MALAAENVPKFQQLINQSVVIHLTIFTPYDLDILRNYFYCKIVILPWEDNMRSVQKYQNGSRFIVLKHPQFSPAIEMQSLAL